MKVGSIGLPAVQYEETEIIDASSTTTINAGNAELVRINPPDGYIYDILAILLYVLRPVGSTAGTHDFDVLDDSGLFGILKGESDFNVAIYFNYGIWISANVDQIPPNDSEQLQAIRGIRLDADNGLDVWYDNQTDANQTNRRYILIWVRKIKIAT